jgi:Phage capsid family
MTLTTSQQSSVRDSLQQCRANIGQIRDQLKQARDLHAAAQQAVIDGKGDKGSVLSAGKEEARLRMELEGLKDEESTYLALMGQGTNGNSALGGQLNEVSDALTRYANSGARMGDFPIAEFSREQVVQWTGRSLMAAAGPAPTPGMSQAAMTRIVPSPTPPQSFLDLVPSVVMEAPSLLYGQEVASAESSPPALVAPGSVKPAVDFAYQDATANPATIAGFIKQNKQLLADVPMLENLIQSRLMTRTRIALEHEIIAGTGATSDRTGQPGIVGLLNTTGIGNVAGVAGNPDGIIDAIVTCLVSGANPNVIALNPTDWGGLLKVKASGSGEYQMAAFLDVLQKATNAPMVPAVGVPPKKFIVGDTNLGLTLLVREGAHVIVSDADTDDLTRNRWTLLCEGRWALAVWVPAAFCTVTIP